MEIEFGDIQETPPDVARRPDQDQQLMVLPIFLPDDDDLPIYVDLDTLREIQEHAEADTKIELGGVLLGGQCLDESGKPFVVVNDCLRAEHYEATKGSFKFTHDTWEQFSRQLDEFPKELRMVGWYHTHPDWGIFLSGMDLFICENFFDKPLDLALVVDPCRHDCGFFQWTDDGGKTTRRTGGFHIFASRFRHAELTQFAEWLEDPMMPSDPRFRGGSSPGTQVVQLEGSQSGWQSATLLAMMAMQFCLLMLIAWRMAAPGVEQQNDQKIRALQERVDELLTAQTGEHVVDAKLQLLDTVIGQGTNAPQHLVTSLADRNAEVAELRGLLRTHQTAAAALEERLAELQTQLLEADQEQVRLRSELDALTAQRVAASSGTTAASASGTEVSASDQGEKWPLHWIAVAAAVGLLCAGGIAASFTRGQVVDSNSEPSQEDAAETNISWEQERHES